MPWIILKRITVGPSSTISFVWDTVNKGVKQVATGDTLQAVPGGYSFTSECQHIMNTSEVGSTNINFPTVAYTRASGLAIEDYCEPPNLVTIETVDMSSGAWPAFDATDYTRTEVLSEQCGFEPNDLRITSITQADSGSDKVVTINATSSNGGLEYSLDGITYQASNQFTITESGTYIAYVRDARGNIVTEAFEVVLDETLYNERWNGEFADDKDTRYTVSIEELEYSGSAETLKFTGTPALINYPQDSDIYRPIRGSELVLGLVSETDYQFSDLFTAIDKKFRVKLSTGGSVIWQGFVTPEAYMEPFTCTPYPISVSFTDGLGVLKRRTFEAPNGEEINTLRSDLDLISFCLRQTGLELPIYTTVNVHEIQMGDFDSDPLSQTYINTNSIIGKTVYDVLWAVLEKWGAVVFFEDNTWQIRNIDEIGQGSYPRRLYNFGGEYQSSDTYDPDVTRTAWSATPRRAWVENNAQIEMLPALKEVKLTVSSETQFNIIQNGDFQDQDDQGNIRFWTDDAGVLDKAVILDDGKQKEVARILGDYSIGSDYITSNLIKLQVEESLIKFVFRMRFKINAPEESTDNEMYAQVRYNGTYFLFSDGSWRTVTAGDTNVIGISASPNEWVEWEVETWIVPSNSSFIEVTLFQAQSNTLGELINSVDIDYVELNYIEDGVKIEGTKSYTSTSDERYLSKVDKNIFFGDYQEYDNPGLVIKNTLFVDDGTNIVDSLSWLRPVGDKYTSDITDINRIEVEGDVTAIFSAGSQILVRGTSQGVYTILGIEYPALGEELTNDPEFDSSGIWYDGLFNPVTYSDGTAEVNGAISSQQTLNTDTFTDSGKTYEITVTIINLSGTVEVKGDIPSPIQTIGSISANGTYTYQYTSALDGGRIRVDPVGSASCQVTLFSVKEVQDKTLITTEEENLVSGACTVEIFPGYMSLIQLLADRMLNQRSRPVYKLTGTINGTLKFSQLLTDSNLPDKKFMITGMDWNLKSRDYRLELVELQDTTDVLPYMLTEDNFYILQEDGSKILMEDAE